MADELHDRALVERWARDHMPADLQPDDQFVRRVTRALAVERLGALDPSPGMAQGLNVTWRDWGPCSMLRPVVGALRGDRQRDVTMAAPGDVLVDDADSDRRVEDVHLHRKPEQWTPPGCSDGTGAEIASVVKHGDLNGEIRKVEEACLAEVTVNYGRYDRYDALWCGGDTPGPVTVFLVLNVAPERTVAQALGLVVASYLAVDCRSAAPYLLLVPSHHTTLMVSAEHATDDEAVAAALMPYEERSLWWRGPSGSLVKVVAEHRMPLASAPHRSFFQYRPFSGTPVDAIDEGPALSRW